MVLIAEANPPYKLILQCIPMGCSAPCCFFFLNRSYCWFFFLTAFQLVVRKLEGSVALTTPYFGQAQREHPGTLEKLSIENEYDYCCYDDIRQAVLN